MTGTPASHAMSTRQWWATGRIEHLQVGGVTRRVFVRVGGAGPAITLLHGFPASSLEWAGIWDRLAERHQVIAVDFLGYGRSEKPVGHRYGLDEQADLVRAVWRRFGIADTALIAYDYGAIIAQLLLASHDRPVITRAVFLNASLFAELYRPRPIQQVALMPVVGALAWMLFTEKAFGRSWSAVFGPDHPLDPQLAHQHWVALSENDPKGTAQRRLLRYIPERADRAGELAHILHQSIPMSFLWGMADPVSGTPIAAALTKRLQNPDLVTYPRIGHCPHLEIPEQVAHDLLARIDGQQNQAK